MKHLFLFPVDLAGVDPDEAAERHNFSQDVIGSRKWWCDLDVETRLYLKSMIPHYVDNIIKFKPDFNRDRMISELNQYL